MRRLSWLALFTLAVTLQAHVPALAQSKPLATGEELPPGALFRFGSVGWRHGDRIFNSALSRDGKQLATVAARSVVVWDVATARPLHRFPLTRSLNFVAPGLAFSPDG